MENQTQLSLSSKQAKIEINEYKHYANSVGNNLQSIQITTKYRYQMMKQEKLKVFCKVAIEEACKRHKIEIKSLSSYILFRLCPDFRKRYPRGHFWNEGYFCASCGSDFERAMKYIENQELHHAA